MRTRDDRGTVMVLTIGLSAVLLLLVAVVVDVSAVVLSRRALAAAADGAAVAAAQQPDRSAISEGLGTRLPLDEPAVAEVARVYAADARAAQPGLQLVGSVDGGTTAVVEGFRTVRLPFSGWLGLRQVRLHVVARAQSPTG